MHICSSQSTVKLSPACLFHRNTISTVVLSPDIFLTRQKESVEVVIALVCLKRAFHMRNPLRHDGDICKHSR